MKISDITLNSIVIEKTNDDVLPLDFYVVNDVKIDDNFKLHVYCRSIYGGHYVTFDANQIESPDFYGF